ncbi:hypothetical protein HY504_03780 [Candidatus Wolfebacteria bacterium]|nr:hypothetical protein [Candidatus Wolfebacteria bacterium]
MRYFHILYPKGGQLSLQVLIFSTIGIILLTGFAVWANVNLRMVTLSSERALAFTIAEAGIEYYRWHLAHAPTDFTDGTGNPGPYMHNYYDKNQNLIGQFVLEITPPLAGSTIVSIRSTGKVASNPGVSKIIEVRMGIPSFAKYAALVNGVVRFGQGTDVSGPIHSNNGIRFDGTAHNLVTSALVSYDEPDHTDANLEHAVHTHVNVPPETGINNAWRPLEAPPNPVASRPDVFFVGRNLSVPNVNFLGVSSNFQQMQTDSLTASGFHASSSGALGYDIVLKTNGTFDLYRVTGLVPSPSSNCTNSQNQAANQGGWGTWSISTESLVGNYPLPANGIIFLEDDAWVRGQITGARLTIASARFPLDTAPQSSITMTSSTLYTNYDGKDVIGFVAQKNINIGLRSEDILRVDAALFAQNGRVGRYYYNSYCGVGYRRNAITTYGMIGSYIRYGFSYTNGTGYQTRNLVYDSNLLYGPPPLFPLTTDPYTILSWNEVK